MADPPIDQLSAGVAAGRSAAIEIWYRRYFDSLYATARRVSGKDEAESLDIVQDAVIRILRTIRPVSEERQLIAWQSLVVRTTAYDYLKTSRRRRQREERAARDRCEALPPTTEEDERLSALRSGIARLDPTLADLLDKRFGQGLTLATIAESLGLSIGTVDGRLRRAMRTLAMSGVDEPTTAVTKP